MWEKLKLSAGQRSLSLTERWRSLCIRELQGDTDIIGGGWLVVVLAWNLGFLSVISGEGGRLLSQALLVADRLLTLYPSASCSALLECGDHWRPFSHPPSVRSGTTVIPMSLLPCVPPSVSCAMRHQPLEPLSVHSLGTANLTSSLFSEEDSLVHWQARGATAPYTLQLFKQK